MNLQELMDAYHEEGLTRELAASRVCQDIVLKRGYYSRCFFVFQADAAGRMIKNDKRK